MEFQKKIKSNLIIENNKLFKIDKSSKTIQFNHNYIPIFSKPKVSYDGETMNNNEQKQRNIIDGKKHSLFLKKIDLKEKKNKYYIEGVYKLFNDENVFLENSYKGKKIIIGKSRNKSSVNMGLRNIHKRATKRTKTIIKSKLNNNSITLKINSNQNNNNNTLANDSIKGRKILSLISKKNDNYISDDELKNIYQECIYRENVNMHENFEKSKNINRNKSFIYDNNLNKNFYSEQEFNNILKLQSKILNKNKLKNIETKKMIDRLSKHTLKDSDKLLMNQINDYRLKKEKLDELDSNRNKILNNNSPNYKNKEYKNINKKLQWLSSLRVYKNKINKLTKQKRRCASSSIEGQFLYSFDKRDILFDLSGQIKPLFAQFTPKINENEKIRDTINDIKSEKRIIKSSSKIINNLDKTNLYKGLNIKGKKLINFEIELSKELEGKKKRIIHYPYKEEDITTKLFAKSYSINNFFVPKSIRNTLELHYNKP